MPCTGLILWKKKRENKKSEKNLLLLLQLLLSLAWANIKRLVKVCHRGLSCARSGIWSKGISALEKSFSINLIQVILWPPFGFLTFLCASLRACLAGVFSSSLCRCPNHLILLFIMISLQGLRPLLLYNSSFDILSSQEMLKALLICLLWNMSTLPAKTPVSVHNSELYRNTLFKYVLKILVLVMFLVALFSKMCFNLL